MASTANAQPIEIDRVAAVVDDTVILQSELVRPLDQLIAESLVDHFALEHHVAVSDAEIDELRTDNDLDDEEFTVALAARGY